MIDKLVASFEELRRAFRVADAVDIAVIAVLLYAALIWFRRSTSRRVIIGISVLTVLYLLAQTFDMYLTSLVFQTAFAVLLVMLIVVFQEEIRRAFEHLAGWHSVAGLHRPATTRPQVDTLVEAAFSMADKKTGALIVLEGREPLGRHIDGGIELAGRVSKPLLYSIFDPGSAGHDGAAIIRHDRVELFGAHLPISKNRKRVDGRGTRHSAALGLAERSDALVIVVSEERGMVSVAEQGNLHEMKSTSELKTHVERFLDEKFPTKIEATWKRFLARDAALKLLAVVLAAVAWLMIAFGVEQIQTSYVVPIEYRNIPQDAQLDEWAPVEALVTLSGSERAFRLLDRRLLKISVDLSDAKDGTVPITEENVRRPPSLEVDRIQPNEIQLRLKR